MQTLLLSALAVLAALAAWWFLRHRGRSADDEGVPVRSQRVDHLDTVAAWPPEATRVLTLQERRAYALLTYALPDHIVLAQVPLARFIRVPTRNSYHEWMRRVGQLCADLVVCDGASQVLAVVEVRRAPGKDTERTRRRHDRMDRVLRKAGVRVIEWDEEAMPHRDSVREQILPTPKGMAMPEAAAAHGAPPPPPATTVMPVPRPRPAAAVPMASGAAPRREIDTLDDEIPGHLEHVSRGESTTARNEPTPSTWFDELESDRMPLHPPGR